jgi:hypothetical protein
MTPVQPSLFDPPAPYRPTSRTSRAAAARIRTSTKHERRDQVYRAIAAAGAVGRTCSELAEQLGRPEHWLTSSIAALLEAGTVADSGRERLNAASGKNQRVLVARGGSAA